MLHEASPTLQVAETQHGAREQLAEQCGRPLCCFTAAASSPRRRQGRGLAHSRRPARRGGVSVAAGRGQ